MTTILYANYTSEIVKTKTIPANTPTKIIVLSMYGSGDTFSYARAQSAWSYGEDNNIYLNGNNVGEYSSNNNGNLYLPVNHVVEIKCNNTITFNGNWCYVFKVE